MQTNDPMKLYLSPKSIAPKKTSWALMLKLRSSKSRREIEGFMSMWHLVGNYRSKKLPILQKHWMCSVPRHLYIIQNFKEIFAFLISFWYFHKKVFFSTSNFSYFEDFNKQDFLNLDYLKISYFRVVWKHLKIDRLVWNESFIFFKDMISSNFSAFLSSNSQYSKYSEFSKGNTSKEYNLKECSTPFLILI